MWEEILKAIPVYFSSMLKFVFGPAGGYFAKLSMLTTMIVTVAGMMTVVIAFVYFGEWLKREIVVRYFKPRKRFTKRSRRFVRIWNSYGMAGVAFLTPLFFTPIGGSILAISFGGRKSKIIIYMFISAVFWSIVFTVIVYFFGHVIFPGYSS